MTVEHKSRRQDLKRAIKTLAKWVVSVNEVEIRGGVGAAIGQAA